MVLFSNEFGSIRASNLEAASVRLEFETLWAGDSNAFVISEFVTLAALNGFAVSVDFNAVFMAFLEASGMTVLESSSLIAKWALSINTSGSIPFKASSGVASFNASASRDSVVGWASNFEALTSDGLESC